MKKEGKKRKEKRVKITLLVNMFESRLGDILIFEGKCNDTELRVVTFSPL